VAGFKEKHRFITIFSLVFAGEAIFFLPFVVARIFRPTMLDYFQIDNTQLGNYFAAYGIVAMISYLFGGILADRFQARCLMALALILTALVGLFIAYIPDSSLLIYAYAWWGFTSIFLFWAAMIRATREWGGRGFQGRAFGWLEGGRGATAALLGSITFVLFTLLTLNTEISPAKQGSIHPFRYVLLTTSILTLLAAVLVWFFVPESELILKAETTRFSFKDLRVLSGNPRIWLLSSMIVCAYVGYKSTDDFTLYAKEVLGFSEANSAGLGTLALWLRAMVAVAAGFLGDRFSKRKIISYLFLLSALSALFIAWGLWSASIPLILLNFVFVALGIYGVRALYFAVFREAKVAVMLTGSAVGLVSFVGFTPDIFMGPVMGYFLDNHPGEYGHRLLFWFLTAFSLIGWVSSVLFNRISAKRKS
jgi:sugar phosphate permease